MQPQRYLSHARGYLELGMVAEAAAELGKVSAPLCDGTEFLAVRLAVLQEQQDWPALREAAGRFVRDVPGEAAAWITWAYATRRTESLAAAEKILLEAEQRHPAEATVQFNLGCYACQRGDLAAAKRRIERAIALEPKFASAAAVDPDLAPLRAAGTTDCQPGA